MTARPTPAAIQAVLLDIEGTTTPIAFVSDVLFPYARTHLRRHIGQHASSPEYQSLFDRLRDEQSADRRSADAPPSWSDEPLAARLASVAAYCEWLMDRDCKSTSLKTLQGHIWENGYKRGELVAEVFADVPRAFQRWHAHDLRIGIFSSGSVLAQQQLFRYSSAGDLEGFLQWHFDTTSGAKADPESYRRIAASIALPAESIVFVSDVTRELNAARSAGMQTRLSIRPGNAPAPHAHGHTEIRTFDDLVA